MKTKLIIIVLILAASSIFTSCKPTDEDIQMSEDILGYWIALDEDGNAELYIPEYCFEEDDQGYLSLNGSQDDLQWEIVKGQLKIYYDESLDYIMGYDQYHSRSLFQINSLEGDHLKVTEFYYQGYQAELDFYRNVQ
jgi:hypothetical protein